MNIEQCLSLKFDIEKYSLEAEEKQELSLLFKANSFRKVVKEKQGILLNIFIEYIMFLINERISNFNFVITEAFSLATDVDNIEKFLLLRITVISLFTVRRLVIVDSWLWWILSLVIKIWHWFSVSVQFLMLHFL